jgi:hypothetical protein
MRESQQDWLSRPSQGMVLNLSSVPGILRVPLAVMSTIFRAASALVTVRRHPPPWLPIGASTLWTNFLLWWPALCGILGYQGSWNDSVTHSARARKGLLRSRELNKEECCTLPHVPITASMLPSQFLGPPVRRRWSACILKRLPCCWRINSWVLWCKVHNRLQLPVQTTRGRSQAAPQQEHLSAG